MRWLMVFLCAGNVFFVGINVGAGDVTGLTLLHVMGATVCGISAMSDDLG